MAKSPRENRVPIMMSDDELSRIDDWRFKNRIATRSEAVRRLAQIALGIEEPTNRNAQLAKDLLRAYNSAMIDETTTADSLLDAIASPVLELAAHSKYVQDVKDSLAAGQVIEDAADQLREAEKQRETQLRLVDRFIKGNAQ